MTLDLKIMKKIFFTLVLVFLSSSIFSQEKMAAKGLRIDNYTKCTQFVVIEWVNNCQCDFSLNGGGTSNIIKIEPHTNIVINDVGQDQYGNYVIPPNMVITSAKVGGGYYCTGYSPVGQPCSNHPLTAQYTEYVKHGEDCKECTKTLAIWKPGDCKNPATLTFTNP